jgi:hypothetical protein
MIVGDLVKGAACRTHKIVAADGIQIIADKNGLGGTCGLVSSPAHLHAVECGPDAIHIGHGGGRAKSKPG